MKKTQIIIVVSLAVVILAVAGFFSGSFYAGKKCPVKAKTDNKNLEIHDKENSYKFINPLLECGEIESLSNAKIDKIKSRIIDFIDKDRKKDLDFISVYFRDLNNGPWFGINEKETFTPASLLKVPLFISYLKLAEDRPEVIQERILYTKGFPQKIAQYYKPVKEIKEGEEYSVKDLLENMIKYSDNNASMILSQMIAPKDLENAFTDLGVGRPENEKYTLSVRTYASFFRILFNATYLNRPMSEMALDILSQVDFKDGLIAGVPFGVTVAHKFGEYDISGNSENSIGKKQLHDCGIIYYPDNPYVLCVMTRGNDFNHLADAIKNISALVYEGMGEE